MLINSLRFFVVFFISQALVPVWASYVWQVSDLKALISSNEFSPRTCVASLYLNEEINNRIKEKANLAIKNNGFKELEDYSILYDFKQGPAGLVDCLKGNYEDVTIIGESKKALGTSLTYERLKQDGTTEFRFLNPRLLSKFISGEEKLSSSIRQITVITCSSEEVLRTDPILQELAEKNNIHFRHQPHDPIAGIISGKGPRARTESLFGYMIAESAQPEDMERVFCLLPSSLTIIGETGKATCLRNRYGIEIFGLSVGIKHSNKLIFFKPKKVDESEKGINIFSIFDIELSFRLTLGLHTSRGKSFAHNTQSYGIGAGLFESIRVKKIRK